MEFYCFKQGYLIKQIFNKQRKQSMKKIYVLLTAIMMFAVSGFAQVTVTGDGAGGSPYATLADAINAVNAVITLTQPTTITTAISETAPAGGYSITATGSAINTLIITGGGNTYTAPTPQAVGLLNDAIFKIVGADYVTIQGFIMLENAGNTATTAASNNMTEWGVALLYASTTNGAQNCTIQNNTITLNRTYQNTFGIYSNSTHSATAPTTSAPATTAAGGNSGLKIYGNTISNVNNGIVVVGTTAVVDMNTGIDIGGVAAGTGNTISNFGTTGAFSGYANVSGSVNGILVRNSLGFNVSYNNITSSSGATGVTAGTLNGIQIPAASATGGTTTVTSNINNNTIALTSHVVAGAINGINLISGYGTLNTTMNVNANNFTTLNHTIAAASGVIIAIFQNGSATNGPITHSISSNTFTNITTSTTGSFTFISNNWARPTSGTGTINNNSIVTAFSKTGAGNNLILYVSNSTSGATINEFNTGNNFSNITVTGATIITGWQSTDGGSPIKTVTNNTFSNWTGGTGNVTGLLVSFSSLGTVSGNTVSNITSAGAITGITSSSGTQTFSQNTVHTLSSSGASSVVIGVGITGATTTNVFSNTIYGLSGSGATSPIIHGIQVTGGTTVNVYKNKIYDLSLSAAIATTNGAVMGITLSSGTTVSAYNNTIGDLRAPQANLTDVIRGISIVGTATITTCNVYYNSVYLNATSSGANFGTSGILQVGSTTATTRSLNLRNNIIVNTSTPAGTGLTVAFRRTTIDLANYAATSNNNLFYAGAPSATNLIFTDGTNSDQTLAAYQTRVSPRDGASITENPPFLSTTGSSANFLHIDPAIITSIESGASPIAGITDDFDGDVRNATSPDIGADEGTFTPNSCTGTPSGGTVTPATASRCVNATYVMTATGMSTGAGIAYQWKVGTAAGGPYVNVTGGTGANTTSYTTAPLTAGVFYYVLEVTCTPSGLSSNSSELELTVNSLPTVTVTPTTATYCNPGGTPVALTASGADTYSWSPAAGLSATNIANPTASPTVTTIYTVTGTITATGCFNTATTTITVNQAPVISSTTATPASVCSGGSTQLQVNASLPINSYSFASTTGGVYETITSPTVLTTVDAGTVDDGSNQVSPAGFSFPFNGTNYTGFSANTNAWLKMAAGAPGTNIPSSLTSLAQNGIFVFGRDANLNTANGGNLTHGAAAGGKYVFQFTNNSGGAGGATSATAYVNAQVILWGSTSTTPGKIEIIYGTSLGTPGSSGSIGIASSAGQYINAVTGNSTALTNATTYPASGTVYTFTPATLTYAWTPAVDLNDATIANPIASNITANTTYTVQVTNAGCTTTGNVTVTVATFAGAPTTQPSTTAVNAGTIDNQVLTIDLPQACTAAETLTQLDLANLSTVVGDVTNAKVYYTTTNTFATTTLFGTTATPGATFSVTGSQLLSTTTRNYFWVVYDVACNAANTNAIDASVSNVVINTVGYAPSPANPTGTRSIVSLASLLLTVQPSTAAVNAGSTNQQVLRVAVPATACGTLTQLDFGNTSTVPAEITNARVYYTTNTTFATTTLFGSTATPGAAFIVTGSQLLSTTAINYFWLVYDIDCAAPSNVTNVADASVTSVTIAGSGYVPTTTNPAGTRTIVAFAASDFAQTALTAILGSAGGNPYDIAGKSLQSGEPSPILNSQPASTNGSGQSNYSWGTAAGNSVWYKLVVPTTGYGSSGNLLIRATTPTSTPSADAQVALWKLPNMVAGICTDPANFTGGVLLAANDDAVVTGAGYYGASASGLNSVIRVRLTPGATYYVQIDGFSTALPTGDLIIEDLADPAGKNVPNNGLGNIHNPTAVDMRFASYEVVGDDGWTYYYNNNGTTTDMADDLVILGLNWSTSATYLWNGTNGTGNDLMNHIRRDGRSLTAPSSTGPGSGTGSDAFIVWSGRNNAAGASADLKPTAPYVSANTPAWHMMNKFWNVFPNVQPLTSIGVRYFYSDQDYTDLNTAAGGIMAQHSDMRFLKLTKSPTTHYTNAEVDPGSTHTAITAGTVSYLTWTNTDAVQPAINQAEFNITSFSGGGGGAALNNPLPIVVNYLRGVKQGSVHNLNWKVTCTSSPTATMILERSGDNRTFTAINNITADALRCAQPFDYVDALPLAGINYYRLKIIDANGKVTYSNTIAMANTKTGVTIVGIVPNPVTSGGNAILNVASAQKGLLRLVVTDITGRQISMQSEAIIAGSNQIAMNFAKLAAGSYNITAITDDGNKTSVRFIKQ